MKQPEKLLTKKGIADQLGVSQGTIDNYRKEGMPVVTTYPLKFHYSVCFKWQKKRTRKSANMKGVRYRR